MDNRVRIPIRVEPEEYKALNDLRHQKDTTFQEVVVGLLRRWYADNKDVPPVEQGVISAKSSGILQPNNKEEAEDIEALLRAKRSKDPLYAAISFMLAKFKVGGKDHANATAQAGKTSDGSKRSTG